MTATANLSINVADVNDVTPQFSQVVYKSIRVHTMCLSEVN